MLPLVWRRLCLGLCGLLLGQAEDPSQPPAPAEPAICSAVPQNLVLTGTIFSILPVTIILTAFCVYKPIQLG
uniref:Uncharacterized protein n=1 Tax=Sciurus vulgaris TaxID=55149 RepID=A0A8D2CKS8_SCIVU